MEKTKRTLVVYHNEDADGLVSAAITWCYLKGLDETHLFTNIKAKDDLSDFMYGFGKVNETDNILETGTVVDFLGTNYAQLSDIVLKAGGCNKFVAKWKRKYDNIIMVDVSFNELDVMLSLYNKYKGQFLWLDHHKAVIDASFEYGFNKVAGIRDTCTSALMLTYHWFFGTYKMNSLPQSIKESNFLLRQLAGYDSWQPENHSVSSLDCALCFTRGFEQYTRLNLKSVVGVIAPILFCDVYDNIRKDADRCIKWNKGWYRMLTEMSFYYGSIVGRDTDEVENIGIAAVDAQKMMWKRAADLFGDSTFNIINTKNEKERTLVLFMQSTCTSLMFDFLKGTQTKHVCVFKRMPTMCKDKQWTISLYNINDDDEMRVGCYLKERYGGGGHKGAGGATISQETFDRIMEEKVI